MSYSFSFLNLFKKVLFLYKRNFAIFSFSLNLFKVFFQILTKVLYKVLLTQLIVALKVQNNIEKFLSFLSHFSIFGTTVPELSMAACLALISRRPIS